MIDLLQCFRKWDHPIRLNSQQFRLDLLVLLAWCLFWKSHLMLRILLDLVRTATGMV